MFEVLVVTNVILISLLVGGVVAFLVLGRRRTSESLHPFRPLAVSSSKGVPKGLAHERILFPFIGPNISSSALSATMRLARADDAVLVPAYVVAVPLHLSLSAPISQQCEVALPLLEVVEQQAEKEGVRVDSRIETGRTPRHALRRLIKEERFDRLVIPAAAGEVAGFDPEDVAWLLENAPGEILVLRPKRTA